VHIEGETDALAAKALKPGRDFTGLLYGESTHHDAGDPGGEELGDGLH
jgi:hypothetical protein